MVARNSASSSNTIMMLSSTKSKNDVMVYMRNRDYGNVTPSTSQASDQPSSSTSSASNPTPIEIPIELRINLPRELFINMCSNLVQELHIIIT